MCTPSPESQWNPELHPKHHGQQSEGGDSAPLLYSGETLPEVLHSALASPTQAEPKLECVQGRATKVMRAGVPLLEDSLRELRLFSQKKRRLQGDLKANSLPALTGGLQEGWRGTV